jgi:hypothetical protein
MAACFLLVCSAAIAAAQPFQTLPEPGKFLGYVATEQPGKWLVFGPGGFTVVQPTVLEGGKAIVWQGDPGEYAAVFFPPGDTVQPLVQKVVLGTGTPKPPVPPTPPPGPPLSPLATQVRDWATTLVPTTARVKCESVAQSLEAISSQMAAGTLTEPAKIIAATRDANKAAVGELRDAWLTFFEEVRKYLNAEAAAGRLATLERHQAIWKDLSTGLRAVK